MFKRSTHSSFSHTSNRSFAGASNPAADRTTESANASRNSNDNDFCATTFLTYATDFRGFRWSVVVPERDPLLLLSCLRIRPPAETSAKSDTCRISKRLSRPAERSAVESHRKFYLRLPEPDI